jgi:hypothetical protein
MRFFPGQLEPGFLVNSPSCRQNALGPQANSSITRRLSKADTLTYQGTPKTNASRRWFNKQKAKLRCVSFLWIFDQKNVADALAI